MTGRDRRVVVVTGGGGGIGAAIAEQLGRQGAFVVTVDPLVTLDGSKPLPTPQETTAERIVAGGGSARASSVSVTDADGLRSLFAELLEEFGTLDAVINVAGISRPTSYTAGSAEDWRAVLSVHLDGYRNVLAAALPIMAQAGRGHILGVTSGSGWRAADTGAYGCAKRAVAALTWQLGRCAPPGVIVNALSPIAVTRMVTAALGRAPAAAGGTGPAAATGGLNLGSMPQPEDIGPLGAHLVSDKFSSCRGEVIFSAGSEVAIVERPRLLEVVGAIDADSLPGVLAAVTPALVQAEAAQASGGGSNARFGAALAVPADELDPGVPAIATCAIVSDRPDIAAALDATLARRGVASTAVSTSEQVGNVDAIVVALSAGASPAATRDWNGVLAEHVDVVQGIHRDATWARAAADHAARAERPVRLVTLTDAVTAGGRTRAQAAAQLARAARKATGGRVAAFAISDEGADARMAAELAAHLLCDSETPGLAGAELVAGPGWFALRSHPRPGASVTLDGVDVPDWLDDVLEESVR